MIARVLALSLTVVILALTAAVVYLVFTFDGYAGLGG